MQKIYNNECSNFNVLVALEEILTFCLVEGSSQIIQFLTCRKIKHAKQFRNKDIVDVNFFRTRA